MSIPSRFRLFIAIVAAWACVPAAHAAREGVVAADGSGDFPSVQAAVDAVPDGHRLLHVIRIKPGIYKEVVTIPPAKGPIMLLGEDAATTVISFGHDAKTLDADGKEIGTSRTASVFVEADDFSAENITFENSFGKGSQALAISVNAERVVFRKCRFLGWQDTVLLNGGKQYFEECYIAGHVDFIFGGATAFFERCEIHCLDAGYITAASTSESRRHGFVFSNCRITAAPGDWQTYLGRPWRPFGSVAFLHTEMPENIRPEGWDNWGNPENEKTARFSEYGSTGPGANPEARVPWAKRLTDREAEVLTAFRVLGQWDPEHALRGDRLLALPPAERLEWETYLQRSAERQEADRAALSEELVEHQLVQPIPPPSGGMFKLPPKPPFIWFQSPKAVEMAEAAISFQTPSGGWSKSVKLDEGVRQPGMHWSSQAGKLWHYVGTFDNRATTEHLRLLAGVYGGAKKERFRDAFLKGLDYVLDAQFPNGGWPQGYPLEGGYHDYITFNDDAMIHVLRLVYDIAERTQDFAFVDEARRAKCEAAFEAGLRCVLAAQVEQEGKPTVWCAQHDPLTLEPVPARLQEPAALSGGESVGVVSFLMDLSEPTDEVVRSIEHALEWFERSRITGMRKTERDGRNFYEMDPAALEPLWARFYDVKTNQPIYPGGQDGILYDSFEEMSAHNGTGYDFVTERPADLLNRQQEKWRKKLGR